ncbi:ABC transporter substrate-binding protein [Pelomonas sp. SE-A7]|uniref:ABC transporter substrate-binding protein n=1 Tax=Pelomonas sp. SE-A7 TaxID=3054953 RepID=UPI00259C6B49|nr:ABC transporter substrate-binding protein [Pelomonas sp. SE-A7]MDM4768184.1 ABC transporter substrate-binding protein [Pelomonas sp. SE-A7]
MTELTRRAALALGLSAPLPLLAQAGRDAVVIGLTLEPPGLDPTSGAASSIAEVVLYNVLEPLTKIAPDGTVQPLLAERWEVSSDQKSWRFLLRRGPRFHNGEPFNAAAVKFSFERAASETSSNKDKRVFANMAGIATPDEATVLITLKTPEPELPFLLGQASSVIVEPRSAAGNAQNPVGTGPYQLEQWQRGSSLRLKAVDGWRAAVAIKRVQFRVISDPAAQVAALLAGDVDAFPRVAVARSLARFKSDPRFQLFTSNSRAKTLIAINHQRKPLDQLQVRQALAAAIDRQAVIAAAADGYGVPIGSHYVPNAPGYVDTTALNAYDPERARALLKQAGVSGLQLTMKLPPVPYARQGGELIRAQLAKVGVQVKLENIEWAQWMASVYGQRNYELTLISHVEPHDLGNYARPNYYWGYRNPAFDKLWERLHAAPREAERLQLLAEIQRLLAQDAAAIYLYQPQWLTVARKNLKGLWTDMPIFANELSALSWT